MLRTSCPRSGISSAKRKFWSKQRALNQPNQYYLNEVKTTKMDPEDGQDFVYGFTNRAAMLGSKTLHGIRNGTHMLEERQHYRKAAAHHMPDFKRPTEPLMWEKQMWWETQIEDEDKIPTKQAHHSRNVTLKKIMEQNNLNSCLDTSWSVWFQDKPVFPWSETRDLTSKIPIKSFDEQKEWRRYKLYHSQNWFTPEMQEKRRLNKIRVEKMDREVQKFAAIQEAVDESKGIEGSQSAANNVYQNFVVINIDDGAEQMQKAYDMLPASQMSVSDKGASGVEEMEKFFSEEEIKYWGKEETSDELLDRFTGEKTDFNYDFLYQVWRPSSINDSKADVWALTNMRILNLNIEGAKGTFKKRNEDSAHFKLHSKKFIKMMDQEWDDFFEPYAKRQRELRIMMNQVYKQRGKKAPYVIH